MEKKKIENKAKKAVKKTDFSKLADMVVIVSLGAPKMPKDQEYEVTKETAEILVNKKVAKLK